MDNFAHKKQSGHSDVVLPDLCSESRGDASRVVQMD
jgi:hypothetical protein